MTYYFKYHSPLGVLTIASDGTHITGLWMEDQKYFGSTMEPASTEDGDLPVIRSTIQWLDRYFNGFSDPLDHIPLRPVGTAFQQQVWKVLCQIPYGKTMTYGQVAALLGKTRMSAQAVGNAIGRNPISILIPCHRVVGVNGTLTGYAGGLKRKAILLDLEQRKR